MANAPPSGPGGDGPVNLESSKLSDGTSSTTGPTLPKTDQLGSKLDVKDLKQLSLRLNGPSQDPSDQSTFPNFQTFLAAQTHLEDVRFELDNFPVKWTCDALSSLANSCYRTLRYLELYGYPNRNMGILDLKILSVCQRLEVLHLPDWGRCSMTFRNMDTLPTSLKKLVICEGEGGEIEIGNPNVFKRLVNLEWLSLFGICFQFVSKSGNQAQERQFCRTLFKGLLNLRKLQGFHLEVIGIGLNRDPSVVKMLNPLDQRLNPADRYPHSSVDFNLTWRSFNGRPSWLESPFNKEKNMGK